MTTGNIVMQIRSLTAADVQAATDLVVSRQQARQPWYAGLLRRARGSAPDALRASIGSQVAGAARGDFGRVGRVVTIASYDAHGNLSPAQVVGVQVRERDGAELLCEEAWQGAALALRAYRE